VSDKHFPASGVSTDGISIRRLGGDDLDAVERLAQLDSSRPPEGRLLGAEVEERLLAVISLDTGESVADPFSRTVELRALLELRAAQLRRRDQGRRERPPRHPHPRARAALAGSPPGAPGWLIAERPRPH
jgi:hypothetical protein